MDMDVNLIYFATHGSTTMEPTSWSAIIIEDGEIESLTGFEQTSLTAILAGLEHCLSRMPSGTPIIIRSTERDLHQIGNSWIKNWMQDGFAEEPDSELIAALLDTLESKKVQWFKPPFTDPLDKQIQTLALEEWHNIPEPESDSSTDLVETDTDESNEGDTSSRETEEPKEIKSPLPHSTPPIESEIEPPIASTTDHPTELLNQQASEYTIEPVIEAIEHDVEPKIQNEACDDIPNEPTVSKYPSDLSISEDVTQASVNIEPSEISSDFVTPESPSLNELPDEVLYPYIDGEGLKQANDILCASENLSIEVSVPPRILGYIDAAGYGPMGSWCFILIDYTSQFALIKAQANRNSTGQRALLQGCIEVLMSIRNRSHTVEIRTTNKDMFDLVQNFIRDPMNLDIPSCWEDEGAFVSQLSYWIEQSKVSIRWLSDVDVQRDQAIRETAHLAKDNLNNLNQGLRASLERRRKFYPLERVVE